MSSINNVKEIIGDFQEQLPPRQREIVELAAQGLNSYQIAERLGCTHGYVSKTLKKVLNKWRS